MPEITQPLTDPYGILKEVHNLNDIKAKTELTSYQIEAINKTGTLALLFNIGILRVHTNDFLILQKSKNRKSMAEFVDGLKSTIKDAIGKSEKSFHLLG